MNPLLTRRGDAPLVVGHRGYAAVAPQNTLASFEAAWRSGAPAIELDLRLTADGVPVVVHDPVVDRVTDGTGAVGELDAATVRSFDAGSTFSRHFAGQRIPVLAEVVEFLAERPGLAAMWELKGLWTPEQLEPVVASIDGAGLSGRSLVQGFWRRTVRSLAAAAPHLPRGFLCQRVPADAFEIAAKFSVATVNPSVAGVLADPGFVGRAHDAGFRVMPWTANEQSEWAALCTAGVDAIITDRPGELRGWLAGRTPTD